MAIPALGVMAGMAAIPAIVDLMRAAGGSEEPSEQQRFLEQARDEFDRLVANRVMEGIPEDMARASAQQELEEAYAQVPAAAEEQPEGGIRDTLLNLAMVAAIPAGVGALRGGMKAARMAAGAARAGGAGAVGRLGAGARSLYGSALRGGAGQMTAQNVAGARRALGMMGGG